VVTLVTIDTYTFFNPLIRNLPFSWDAAQGHIGQFHFLPNCACFLRTAGAGSDPCQTISVNNMTVAVKATAAQLSTGGGTGCTGTP